MYSLSKKNIVTDDYFNNMTLYLIQYSSLDKGKSNSKGFSPLQSHIVNNR